MDWISVKNELPEFNKRVLVADDGDGAFKASIMIDFGRLRRISEDHKGKVYHWEIDRNGLEKTFITHWAEIIPPKKE